MESPAPHLRRNSIQSAAGQHRPGAKSSTRSGRHRPGLIIWFTSERLRDAVYRSRGSLKDFNSRQQTSARIYLNEDLTARRSSIAYKTKENYFLIIICGHIIELDGYPLGGNHQCV